MGRLRGLQQAGGRRKERLCEAVAAPPDRRRVCAGGPRRRCGGLHGRGGHASPGSAGETEAARLRARAHAHIAAAAWRERQRRANLRRGTGCRSSTTTCTGRSSPTTKTFASSLSRSFQSSDGSGVRGPLCAGVCGVVRTECVGMGGWGAAPHPSRLGPAEERLILCGWGPQRTRGAGRAAWRGGNEALGLG